MITGHNRAQDFKKKIFVFIIRTLNAIFLEELKIYETLSATKTLREVHL